MGIQKKRVFEPGASAQYHGEKLALAEPGMWSSRLVACSASTVQILRCDLYLDILSRLSQHVKKVGLDMSAGRVRVFIWGMVILIGTHAEWLTVSID
jgi:hypothetical protein